MSTIERKKLEKVELTPRFGTELRADRETRWEVDRQTGTITDKLADAHNHVIDALRYAMEGARRAGRGEFEVMTAGPRLAEQAFGAGMAKKNGWVFDERGWGSARMDPNWDDFGPLPY